LYIGLNPDYQQGQAQIQTAPGEVGIMISSCRAVRDRLILVGLILLTGGQIGCQMDPHVSIDGQNPPTFKLSGPGNSYFFWIVEVGSEEQLASLRPDSPAADPIWKIVPNPDFSDRIADLPSIRYGDIPKGFKQTVPEKGSPPPLKEGIVYSAGGPTYNADSGAAVWFVVHGEKTIEVSWRH